MACNKKCVFITVGTTKFESLIEKITSDSVLKVFSHLGFTHLSIQIGHGSSKAVDTAIAKRDPGFSPHIEYFRLKSSIQDDISAADLVISHAGSGSVLDCLSAGRKLLVVINNELMDNHQVELAERLAEDSYLHYCFVPEIESTLENVSWNSLKPFPPGEPEKFASFLEECIGFKGV